MKSGYENIINGYLVSWSSRLLLSFRLLAFFKPMCIYYVKSLERYEKTTPASNTLERDQNPRVPMEHILLLYSPHLRHSGPLGVFSPPSWLSWCLLKIHQTIDKARRLAPCPSGGGQGTQGEPPWIQQASQSQGFFFFLNIFSIFPSLALWGQGLVVIAWA